MSSPEKIMKILFQVFVLFIAVYALICTVYSDVIIRNDNEFFNLSKLKLPDKDIEKNFNEMIKEEPEGNIGETEKDKILYVFVLDISGSVIIKDINKIPKNYDDKIIDIDKRYNYQIDIKKDISLLNLSKLRLYELFLDLYDNPETYENDMFAIWTLMDESKKKYPEKKKIAKIKERGIIAALKKISGLEIEKPDAETDFVNLLDSILKSWENESYNIENNIYEQPNIIITFITDVLYDVDDKKLLNLNKNWEKMKRIIEYKNDSRISMNLIALSNLDLEHQRSFLALYTDHLEWFSLKKDFIWEDRETDLLFPVTRAKDNLTFYYSNPSSFSNSSVVLNFREKGEKKIRLSLLSENNTPAVPRMSIYCDVPGTGQNKKIFSGGSHFDADLKEEEQQVKFTYKDRIPEAFTTPFLKISDYNERASYLIPIYFSKKMPEKAANIFSFLQLIIKLLPLSLGIIAVFSVNKLWKVLFFALLTFIYFIIIIL